MKNKKNLITYLILLLILISISNGVILKKSTINQIKSKNSIESKLKKIDNYKEKNLKRYINYYKKNKNLKYNQIIIDVNIGLDNPYYSNTKKAKLIDTEKVLVNKYNYLEKNYTPKNLQKLSSKYSNSEMYLVQEAANYFEKMSQDASKENLNIIAMSTYRSYQYQEKLYNKYTSIDGKDLADTYSARPGYSEHQTGLAVDVYNKELPYTSFENTKEFLWLQENAHKYGYILRYPQDKTKQTGYQYEPWHYRYVGIEIATNIYNNKQTYEEYYTINFE